MEKEIKAQLKNWSKLVRKYQQPDTWKASTQLLNTFIPFVLIWVVMYFMLDYSLILTYLLGVVMRALWYGYLLFNMTVDINPSLNLGS